jgi:hypothetical protein
MVHKVPEVSDGRLWGDQLPGGSSIPLDSPQWFAWLEAATTTSFTYALFNRQQGYIDGFMTVRKERRQRGASYWSAYRRAGGRVRKIYLGRSWLLTQAQLAAAAARLHPRDGPPAGSGVGGLFCGANQRCCEHSTGRHLVKGRDEPFPARTKTASSAQETALDKVG